MQDEISGSALARFIDHTLLKPESNREQIIKVCEEALEFQFFGVCVNSSWIPLVVERLKGSSVTPVAVIGFPLGTMSTFAKSAETDWCIKSGAREIDMVLHVGQLKDGNYSYVQDDIAAVVKAAGTAPVKVILETALLTNEEKKKACEISVAAGAKFVKTCTGFGGGAADVADISLMRKTVGPEIGVKASGGVKSLQTAQALIQAGANRIGTSSGVALVQGTKIQGGY